MFAVLYIADFALQAVLRNEQAVRGPAALFDGTQKKSLVLAINTQAQAAGVERGMTAPQAVARCPRLLIRTAQATAEKEAQSALLTVGFTLSPAIEDTAPGLCTIDLKGVAPDRRKQAVVAAVVELSRLGLTAAAGLARTPLLSLYAARAVQPVDLSLKSKSEPEKNVFAVHDDAAFLSRLPLAAADPSPVLAEVFASWGLRTLGDFTALPRDEIIRRFGAEGFAFWTRATGGSERPLHLVTPEQSFAARMEFENAVETLEPLLFILRRFLTRLALELAAAQLVTTDLELRLELEDDTQQTLNLRLPEPTGDEEILFRALQTQLEPLRTAASIQAVELRLSPARSLVRQQGLFDTGLRDPYGFAETLARVAAIIGADQVGTPRREDTHRPDAIRMMPPLSTIPPLADTNLHLPLGLPMRRYRPPLPVKLELTEQRPTYLWTERFHGAIAQMQGPWLSSGGWWQNDQAWARAEWDIALADGGLYRLSRVDAAYFIEGEYD